MQRYLELRWILGRSKDVSVNLSPGCGPVGIVDCLRPKNIHDNLMIGRFSYLKAPKEHPAVLRNERGDIADPIAKKIS